MSIHVALNHKTQYSFDRLISLSPHVFRLRPAPHCRSPIQSYSLAITPTEHFINWHQDPFGNFLARVVFPEKTKELTVSVDIVVEMIVINPFDFFIEDYVQHYPFQYDPQLKCDLVPYMEIKEKGPLLKQWIESIKQEKDCETINFLVAVNSQLNEDINYTIRLEPGIKSCEDTLKSRSGSCRDTSWLLVQILRHFGLAARFVSGYLIQLTADVKALDGPQGTDKDFTDLHAWAEVYIPGAGWIGLDPTSGLFAGEGHIPLACSPDPASAAAVTGSTDPCESTLVFTNSIKRIHEDPRVTRPYTDKQWTDIDNLGRQIDEELQEQDVRLSMGGEPTFISIDNMDDPEWNITADSDHKRKLARDLLKRMQESFAPRGLLQHGQGKWYPGEQLPRWRLSCYWRTDGVSMWENKNLLDDQSEKLNYKITDVDKFISALAKQLGISTKYIIPAYEDIVYYLWHEGNLPANVDPLKFNLKNSLERQYSLALLERGLDVPKGYALPLQWDDSDSTWGSSEWKFRRNHMFLIPGGSAMGFRLPLSSLIHEEEDELDPFTEQSQFQDLPPLPDPHKKTDLSKSKKEKKAGKAAFARTALAVEIRDGRLYVFLPPTDTLEEFVDLIAAIERTAKSTGYKIILEGYEAPTDYRLKKFQVTPDPGVIEVNIHPANSWQELSENITTLYEQARLCRLGTEKFMIDGRHIGTGGGNHVVLGGATPADSPLLRRPHLLRSLVNYWQHHPGLSYLFSSLFIGPTSQAPRVDEARDETLYELEIAFNQIPDGEVNQFWLGDRVLRNLLVDLTGNTHRAEFCIDKLYSPDRESGRLGLLELRAFEMPPHARMSLTQALLVRGLVMWFWNKPYHKPLVRWGTALHDQFMLPHFVWNDLKTVINDLNQAGYPFSLDWFKPFQEFRFPRVGVVDIQGMKLELRAAIEPWNVLGEEVSEHGTARYVDSSVERIQVKVTGMTDSRHIVMCNKRRLPMHSTGIHGTNVTGLRFKAWQPESALHPTVKPHTPLVFDIVDTWNGRSIGGCTYNVTHRGGRNYETLPVNAFEAEGRRISRFWDHGHSQGTIDVVPEMSSAIEFIPNMETRDFNDPILDEIDEEYPYTLDLRKMP